MPFGERRTQPFGLMQVQLETGRAGGVGGREQVDDLGRRTEYHRQRRPQARTHVLGNDTLRQGNFADVTVFDPKSVIDRATYTEPFQYSEGIEYVVVNGVLVLDKGKHTGKRSGRVIRHGP